MKTLPYAPARPRSTRKLMVSLAQSLAILGIVLWATSYTYRFDPDGSKSIAVDAPSFLRAIEIIATK